MEHQLLNSEDERLKVAVRATVLLDGELFQEVNANDCTWAIEDPKQASAAERHLVLTLDKKLAANGKRTAGRLRWRRQSDRGSLLPATK